MNDLCGKTLLVCHKEKVTSYGSCVFEIPFDGEDQKNAILAPLIDYHDPDKTVSKESNIQSGSFNNAEQFPSMSLSILSAVLQKVDEINSLLTSFCRLHFGGMTIVCLSYSWTFIVLHSVCMNIDYICFQDRANR